MDNLPIGPLLAVLALLILWSALFTAIEAAQQHLLAQRTASRSSDRPVARLNFPLSSLILCNTLCRSLVVIISNLRDEDDESLLGAVRRLGKQHRVLVTSLREELLDSLRQAPVQTLSQALTYCGTVDLLNARADVHERLNAHGVPVLDATPHELGAALVTRYLEWKKAGVF